MRRWIRRYVEVAGCEGREEEAAAEISRNLRWLLGALGEAKVELKLKRVYGRCVVRADMAAGGLLDAVIFAISLSRVGGTYLRPLRTYGTLRKMRGSSRPDRDAGFS